jgi:hypothetical protein
MSLGFWVGLAMFVTAIFLFVMALPRHGEVVWYLKDRDGAQSLYMMFLVGLLASGAILSLTSFH